MTEDAGKTCPGCGQTVKAAALICRFCRTSFQSGLPAPGMTPPPPTPSGGSKTLVLILIIVGVLVVAPCIVGIPAALLLPAVARAIRQAKLSQCVNNQAQLWRMQNIYMSRFGGREHRFPSETGGDFWLKLTQTNPPLIDSSQFDIYECPLEGTPNGGRTTDYRGPASDVNLYGDGDPVGADLVGNHGAGEGGCVLRKSGDVMACDERDPVWQTANRTTRP